MKGVVDSVAKDRDIELASVEVAELPNKWGDFNPKTKALRLSKDVLDLNSEQQRYVILHEIMHADYPNHGQLFQMVMTALMPNWKEVEESLPKRKSLSGATEAKKRPARKSLDTSARESHTAPDPKSTHFTPAFVWWLGKVKDSSGHEHDESGRFGSGGGSHKPSPASAVRQRQDTEASQHAATHASLEGERHLPHEVRQQNHAGDKRDLAHVEGRIQNLEREVGIVNASKQADVTKRRKLKVLREQQDGLLKKHGELKRRIAQRESELPATASKGVTRFTPAFVAHLKAMVTDE